MFIARTRNPRGHMWYGLVERDWDPQRKQPRKRTIASLARVLLPLVDAMDAVPRQQRNPNAAPVPPAACANVQLGEARKHGAVRAVLRVVEQLQLDKRLDRTASPHRQRVVAMRVQQVLSPGSKLSVERALARRHLTDGAMVLDDVSSSDFEGYQCPLGIRGYSRDHRPDWLQLVYGRLCAADGRPVSVSAFSGNTADSVTVPAQVARLQRQYNLRHVVLVGDRGMLPETRIRADVAPAGLDWITALGAKSLRRLVAEGAVQPSLFDEPEVATVTSERDPGERLVVCYNPLLADCPRRERADLLAKAKAQIRTCASMYARGRLGRDACHRRLGQIRKWKMRRHFRFRFDPDTRPRTWTCQDEAIATEAATDGLYVVRTSVAETRLTAADAVRAYKDLQHVETAFQTWQSVLRVRPIRHDDEKRVRGHLFLCMLAYYVTWHLRQALRPMLLDDPAPADDPAPVGPRPRSASGRDAIPAAARMTASRGSPCRSC